MAQTFSDNREWREVRARDIDVRGDGISPSSSHWPAWFSRGNDSRIIRRMESAELKTTEERPGPSELSLETPPGDGHARPGTDDPQ